MNTVVRRPDGSTTTIDGGPRPVAWHEYRLLVAVGGRAGVWTAGDGVRVLGDGTPLGFLSGVSVLAVRDGTPVHLAVTEESPADLPARGPLDWERGAVVGGLTRIESGVLQTAGGGDVATRLVGWTSDAGTTTVAEPTYAVPPGELAEPDDVTYVDSAGEVRDAWLLRPPVEPGPCLAHLYGYVGRRDDFDRKFGRALRYLNRRRYGVLVPAHGGERFDERRVRDYAAAARWVTAQPWSDGTVSAVGHSAGGYDVLAQAVWEPEAWTAGVSWNGIADLRGFYETMAASRARVDDQLGHAGLDRLDELSPARHAGDVGFPLLVLAGEHDWMADQLDAFATDAANAGEPVEHCVLEDCAHWTLDLDLRERAWRRIEAFLDDRH